MVKRLIKPLSRRELDSLTTKRLLAYLRRLQQCEESIETSDWQDDVVTSTERVMFKSSKEWRFQYDLVKSLLAARPNTK